MQNTRFKLAALDTEIEVAQTFVDRCVEVKVRGTGFAQLYKWLASRDLLVVRCDGGQPLVVCPLKLAIEIAIAAEKAPR